MTTRQVKMDQKQQKLTGGGRLHGFMHPLVRIAPLGWKLRDINAVVRGGRRLQQRGGGGGRRGVHVAVVGRAVRRHLSRGRGAQARGHGVGRRAQAVRCRRCAPLLPAGVGRRVGRGPPAPRRLAAVRRLHAGHDVVVSRKVRVLRRRHEVLRRGEVVVVVDTGPPHGALVIHVAVLIQEISHIHGG